MDIDKNKLRKEFTKHWKKHYDVKVLKDYGFHRQQCKKCNRWFWAPTKREHCADASCIGYQFIGNSPVKKAKGYIECWKIIEKYFVKHKHKSIPSYPTVARWRDDLYFTVASINDFQPYVVSGELPPPANPLIVPQSCIRFSDISNVGVSGRHYTNFVMLGQHAFNKNKKLTYWKDEALGHDIKFMKELGIPTEELVFIEDVWAGGGNYGPCIEYFCRGLELGNCVFMQYEIIEGKHRELENKVIDMGAGLERFPWITNGDPTSYDATFGEVIKKLRKEHIPNIDQKLYEKYAKMAGGLDAEEVDIEREKKKVEQSLEPDAKGFLKDLRKLQGLYAIADHTLTTLFTSTDGMLPSNAGGGYNIRMILRRIFGLEEEYELNLNFEEILKGHANHRKELFPRLQYGVETTAEIIKEEKKKYLDTENKAKGKITNLIKKGKEISQNELITLYKSDGIPPESVAEAAEEKGIEIEVPANFYRLIQEGEGEQKKKGDKKIDVKGFANTRGMYYAEKGEFEAKVLGTLAGKYVILDKSAFYPESGGQINDVGTLNGKNVKYVLRESGVILHEVDGISWFKKGQKVNGIVDISRRIRITRHHLGAHMLNAACRNILGRHIWQAGAYKDEHKAHLDVTHYKRITEDELKRIEQKANEYVMANLPIKTEILPRNKAEEKYGFTLYQGGAIPGKELRIVKIGTIDVEACGGTHHMLKHTGEIGCFKIVKRESVQNGIERITYKCGEAAIKFMEEKESRLKRAGEVIGVSEQDLEKGVERFFKEWKEQRKEIEKLKKKLAEDEFERFDKSDKEIHFVDYDIEFMKQVSMIAIRSKNSLIGLINKEGHVVCGAGKDARIGADELLKEIISKYGGGGGGSRQFASGKVNSFKQ